jgi:hypothetical protein
MDSFKSGNKVSVPPTDTMSAEYYRTQIAKVKVESEARALDLIQKARDGLMSYTEAWYSMPGPEMSRQYPFLSYAQVVDLDKAMRKEWDETFWATRPVYPTHRELCDAARVWADTKVDLYRRLYGARVKAEGEAWLDLWGAHEKAAAEEREALIAWMWQPRDRDAEVEEEARRRLANPAFESEVRRRMKQIEAEQS